MDHNLQWQQQVQENLLDNTTYEPESVFHGKNSINESSLANTFSNMGISRRDMNKSRVSSLNFYLKQFDQIYTSDLEIKDKEPAEIIKELEEKAFKIKKDNLLNFGEKADLLKIKADVTVHPDIIAREVADEINQCMEVNCMQQVDQILRDKQSKQNKKHLALLKKSKEYKEHNHYLNFKPTFGKQIQLLGDCNGQQYIVSQFTDFFGIHLHIYIFQSLSGLIGKQILRVQLVENVGERNKKRGVRGLQPQPEEKNQQSINGESGINKQKVQNYNIFNKMFVQKNEFIYFMKVVNDFNKFEASITQMRFNLITEESEELSSSIVKKERLELASGGMRTPSFGIEGYAFPENDDEKSLQGDLCFDPTAWLECQFVLLIHQDFKSASLRSLNKIQNCLTYVENEKAPRWNLLLHQNEVNRESYQFTIGGLINNKTYISLLNGVLLKERSNVGNSMWVCQVNRKIDCEKDKEISEKHLNINHSIIITKKTKQDKIYLARHKLNDPQNQQKLEFMKNYGINFGEREGLNMLDNFQEQEYITNQFHNDLFLILQNQITDQTYFVWSQVTSQYLKIIQMKTTTNSIICKTWTPMQAHPFTKMIYKAGGRGVTSIVQVHPIFGDVMSNGEHIFNQKSQDISQKLVAKDVDDLKPVYFDHFIEGQDNKINNGQQKHQFQFDRPSRILTACDDDRKMVPRLGFQILNNTIITYLDVYQLPENISCHNQKLKRTVDNSIQQSHSTDKKMFINSQYGYGWQTVKVPSKWSHTQYSPSSSIECINERKRLFKQNWQVCILSSSGFKLQIFEYQLVYREDDSSYGDKELGGYCTLTMVGRFLVLLKEAITIKNQINFVPYYDNTHNLIISGTQLIPEIDCCQQFHYIFQTPEEKDIQFKTNLCNCSFKIFENEQRQMIGIMIRTRICEKYVNSYNESEKNLIFKLQQRVIANMIQNIDIEIDFFVEKMLNSAPSIKQPFLDIFTPLQIFECQSLIDYLTPSPNIIKKIVKDYSNQKFENQSLIGRLLDSVEESVRHQFVEDLTSSLGENFIRTSYTICDDLFYNNPMQRCFEDLKMRRKSCNALINQQLNQPVSKWVHGRLMLILPLVIKGKKNLFQDYGRFFEDYNGRHNKTNFSIKLIDVCLPDFASQNEKSRILLKTEFGNAINNQAAIGQIMTESLNDPKIKQFPVNHFQIDFRLMRNVNKLRSDLQDSNNISERKITMYQILYITNRISKKYGDDFEKYDSLRALIDYQFHTHTRPFFKKQLLIFVFFFFIPFTIQLLLNVPQHLNEECQQVTLSMEQLIQKYVIFSSLGVCQLQNLYLAFKNITFLKVSGFRKFLKNTQNITDCALTTLLSCYTICRIYDLANDLVEQQNLYNEQIHCSKKQFLDRPYYLFMFVLLTLSLICLIIFKLTFIIQYNETYSLVYMNFRNCIIEILPLFSVVFIFIAVLCFMYTQIGLGLVRVDQDYPELDVVMSTFFFVLENTLGTPQRPKTELQDLNSDSDSLQQKSSPLQISLNYAILFLWMAQQYWMYTFLILFFTVVIIKTFKNSLRQELVYCYRKKAELNKFYLIFNQAWSNKEEIECLILSANTNEKEQKWDIFTTEFKEQLNTHQEALNIQLFSSNQRIQQNITQFSKDVKDDIKISDQEAWNKIKELNDIYKQSFRNQEIKGKEEIERQKTKNEFQRQKTLEMFQKQKDQIELKQKLDRDKSKKR